MPNHVCILFCESRYRRYTGSAHGRMLERVCILFRDTRVEHTGVCQTCEYTVLQLQVKWSHEPDTQVCVRHMSQHMAVCQAM